MNPLWNVPSAKGLSDEAGINWILMIDLPSMQPPSERLWLQVGIGSSSCEVGTLYGTLTPTSSSTVRIVMGIPHSTYVHWRKYTTGILKNL